MAEKEFSKIKKYYFFIGGIFIITLFSFFIINGLKANILYEKAVSLNEPFLKSEIPKYYKEVLALISKAISYDKQNADYYAGKADYLFKLAGDNFPEATPVDEAEIENLYKKAISLDPVNFEHHLKLGWFYINNKNSLKAKSEFAKVIKLYPTDYQVYLYLAKYHILNKNEKEAFINLILSLWSDKTTWYNTFVRELDEAVNELPGLIVDWGEKEIKLTVYSKTSEFDFKKEEFPHLNIPLKFRVYTKDLPSKVILYSLGSAYADFEKTESTPEYAVYELDLSKSPADVYLDDLKIEANGYSVIDRVELIKKF